MAYCWPIRTQNLLNPTLSQGQLNNNGADIYSICTCLSWQKSNEDEKVVSVQVKEFLNAQCFGKLSRSYFVILFQHQTIFCEYVQSGDQETFPLRQRTLTFAMMENEDITSSYITTCVLNAFLSYTAVMLNCLVNDLRLSKTLIITKTLKNAASKPGCFWSGCWFDGTALVHCLSCYGNGTQNWKQSSL